MVQEKGKYNWILNVSLSICSLLFVLFSIECGTRIFDCKYAIKNFLAEEQTLFTSGYPSQYDALLGWIPKEGFSGRKNFWGTKVTIGKHGIRSNGRKERNSPYSSSRSPILAVGDSFTFGDQVSDHETWPALLEGLLPLNVINAGVFGYGIDQTFLRAKHLMNVFKPDIVIFSFSPDDIVRCNFSQRTAVNKPYFSVNDSGLVLNNIPVTRPSQKHVIGLGRHLAGYSYFIHKLMMTSIPGFWLQGKKWFTNTKVHTHGEKVSCLLFHRFAEIARAHGVETVYVLVQYEIYPTDKDMRLVRTILRCIDGLPFNVIDLEDHLSIVRDNDLRRYHQFFQGHMTYEGNLFIAKVLHNALEKQALRNIGS